MALTVKIKADASHFKKTIAGIEVQASGLTGVMAKLGGSIPVFGAALAGAAAAAVALGAGIAFIKDASGKAAGIESLTMQFETLLGSAEKAGDRMKEIKEFAASTPFEVANLSETSKLLQTLGGDLMATGAGLRMVGDAASIAGQPIQEVGLHMGRLFNAITSGTSAGESVARLQELGLMTGKVKLQFEALAAAQKKGVKPVLEQNEALALLQGVFAKTAGAMERLSQTTEGKLSNMRDAVDNLKVSFGTGFNEGLKSALDATNSFLPSLEDKFSQVGAFIGTAIKDAVRGDYALFAEAGLVVAEAVAAGFQDVFGNMIVDALRVAADSIATAATAGIYSGEGLSTSAFGPKVGMKERAQDLSDKFNDKFGELNRKAESKQQELPPGFVRKHEDIQQKQLDYLIKIYGKKEGTNVFYSR